MVRVKNKLAFAQTPAITLRSFVYIVSRAHLFLSLSPHSRRTSAFALPMETEVDDEGDGDMPGSVPADTPAASAAAAAAGGRGKDKDKAKKPAKAAKTATVVKEESPKPKEISMQSAVIDDRLVSV